MGTRNYEKVWVKAAPLTDPALEGRAKVRKPESIGSGVKRYFTEQKPQLVDKTPAIVRLLSRGELVETSSSDKAPAAAPAKQQRPAPLGTPQTKDKE